MLLIMKFSLRFTIPIFTISSICIHAGCFPDSMKHNSPIIYNNTNNLNNIEQTFDLYIAHYSNTPTITVMQSELNSYEVFNYLYNNTIQNSQHIDYYLDRMTELKNSLLKLNSNIENNNIQQQRIKILRGYFGEILDCIVTEAQKQHLYSNNNNNIASTLNDFRVLYYQLLDNNENMNNEQITQMYNEFINIFSNHIRRMHSK